MSVLQFIFTEQKHEISVSKTLPLRFETAQKLYEKESFRLQTEGTSAGFFYDGTKATQ